MKILIVDDHAMIRGGVKALCGEAELLEAENGKAALILLKAE
jgi:DNA-binding NarL/FixJ family response regulator